MTSQTPLKQEDFEQTKELLTDFAWCADQGEGVKLTELFCAEGVLQAGASEYSGRENISQECSKRAQGRTTRHFWSNLRIDHSDGQLNTTAIQLTFEKRPGEDSPQLRISDLRDKFVCGSEGRWLFAQRTVERVLALAL